jgi:hypothetical protein
VLLLVLFTGGRRGRQYISSITSELGSRFSGSHLRREAGAQPPAASKQGIATCGISLTEYLATCGTG